MGPSFVPALPWDQSKHCKVPYWFVQPLSHWQQESRTVLGWSPPAKHCAIPGLKSNRDEREAQVHRPPETAATRS